jgi:hypothetical protein
VLRRGSGGARRRPAGRSGAGLEELGARSPDVQVRIPQAETQKKAEYRRPKPRLGISAFGFRPPFGPRVSGFGFEPLRPRVGGAVQTRPCKGGQVGQGTPNAAFWPMTILLICWAGISSVFCLAFLSVAARPAPRLDEQIASPQELAVALQNARTASVSVGNAVPSPCQAA